MGLLQNLQNRFIIKPVADRILTSLEKAKKEDTPKQFSVPMGFNAAMSSSNKRMTSSTVDFQTLRTLSINHETTRAAINARKRQITQLGYDIVDTDDDIDPESTVDDRQKIKDALTNIGGDGVRFRALLDKLIEDTMALDALCFYKQRDRGGRLIRIIPIDASTIKLRVDESGARPMPPEIAYEQWIRGEKVAEMTTDEMDYEMMNPRTDSPYGLSPIESMIITLDSSMRAMLYNLHYLSDNNLPQGFLNMPDGWTVDQIKEYKEYFDAMVSGSKNTSKLYPIPAASTYTAVSKPSDYSFAEFFDYLDRKVCMLFDVTPQELGITLKQYKENAEGQELIQQRKGVKPLANFLNEIFTDIIKYEFGYPQYAFKFTGLDGRFTTDDVAKLLPIGVIGIDEARNDRGLKKLGVDNFVATMGTITPISQIIQLQTVSGVEQPDSNLLIQESEEVNPDPNGQLDQDSNGDETNKMEKPITIKSKPRASGFKFTQTKPRFQEFRRDIKKALVSQMRPFTDEDNIDRVVNYKKDATSQGVRSVIKPIEISNLDSHLQWALKEGGNNAYANLGIAGTFGVTSDKFKSYLSDRSNYLINSVDSSTKDYIVNQINNGKDNALTNAEIAGDLADRLDSITNARANVIVNTEVANAMGTAELETFAAQGVTMKVWVTSGDALVCPLCADNEAAGAIPLDSEFPSGDDTYPAHPNCRCMVQADVASIGQTPEDEQIPDVNPLEQGFINFGADLGESEIGAIFDAEKYKGMAESELGDAVNQSLNEAVPNLKDFANKFTWSVKDIDISDLQPLAEQQATNTRYAADIKNGATFPMPIVTRLGDTKAYDILDGTHRIGAARILDIDKIPVLFGEPK